MKAGRTQVGTRSPGTGEARSERARRICLLTPLHPDRGLSHALVQHLAHEVPSIEFTLAAREPVDAIWICGYEAGHAHVVRGLRRRHRDAVILVTGRDSIDRWEKEVHAAGADLAFAWPIAFDRLEGLLRTGHGSGASI